MVFRINHLKVDLVIMDNYNGSDMFLLFFSSSLLFLRSGIIIFRLSLVFHSNISFGRFNKSDKKRIRRWRWWRRRWRWKRKLLHSVCVTPKLDNHSVSQRTQKKNTIWCFSFSKIFKIRCIWWAQQLYGFNKSLKSNAAYIYSRFMLMCFLFFIFFLLFITKRVLKLSAFMLVAF